jgi:molecular chaperone HtpG
MANQKGNLSIESKNVFTILKKSLYREQDIVFRELISNACDAINKLTEINGKFDGKINVNLTENKLIISDNGIGMNANEVDKYINNIAFSGATDFIENTQKGKGSIIGHFGVGFYSAFMLSNHVAIESKSYKETESAVCWDCNSNMEYEMKSITKEASGTDVILQLEKGNPFTKDPKLVFEAIKKYFEFNTTPIYFTGGEYNNTLVNDPVPEWKKLNIDEDKLNEFYKTTFKDGSNPLFHIKFESLDIGIRGILFFRETKNDTQELDGTIKIFSRGVYIGENIPQLIPKYVNLQCGIIEVDNLPLVVSRSDISENDSNDIMALTYECLTQEVAIAFNNLFTKEREKLEKHWGNLNAFVKYGTLKDKIFGSVMTRKVIFKDLTGNFQTIEEYLENVAKGKHNNVIYYCSDELEQAHYIEIFRKCNLNALYFDHVIDKPFMQRYEVMKPTLRFIRLDSNIEDIFNGSLNEGDEEKVKKVENAFKNSLGNRLDGLTMKITNLEQTSIAALIINDEKSRRMVDMMEIYGYVKSDDFSTQKAKSKSTLLINLNNDIIKGILSTDDKDKINLICNQLLDLSLMAQQKLSLEDTNAFINRSEEILMRAVR